MFCCQKIYDFGVLAGCGPKLSLGMPAPSAGVFRMEATFQEVIFTSAKAFEEGEALEFELEGLNEAFVFIGRLYGPDDSLLPVVKGGIPYDCFSFETAIEYAL